MTNTMTPNKRKPKDGRYYNGAESELMNAIYDALADRTDLACYADWPALSLYMARACQVLQKQGWQKVIK
ncbi:MAG: hypothetical protein PHN44_07320 [Candidatus Marinimicrobia bacterium]|nr:hypothetical protein [Candidatus Neomarinimicrobiota bacterium]MDD5265149.1 hypothetical protein [Candidatus Bipolaricaulis sp.]